MNNCQSHCWLTPVFVLVLHSFIAVVEVVNKVDYRELKQQLLPRILRMCSHPASLLNPLPVRVAAMMCIAKIAQVFDSDAIFGTGPSVAGTIV